MQQVICLGSWQGGDAAAWLLGEQLEAHLQAQSAPRLALQIHCCLAPAQMLGLFKGAAAVLLIDASCDLPLGRLELIAREDVRYTPSWSSHGLELVAALDLIEALGEMPPVLQILALGVGASSAPPEQIAEQALPAVLAILGMAALRAQ